MSDTTYNGWSNYATWRVNLEIFDGQSLRDITGSGIAKPSELKDAMREYAEELIEQTSSAGLARDYALAFLSDVNWWELAEAKIADYEEEGEEE
jgi:hypothetical protein